jgi:hypothetical protein
VLTSKSIPLGEKITSLSGIIRVADVISAWFPEGMINNVFGSSIPESVIADADLIVEASTPKCREITRRLSPGWE